MLSGRLSEHDARHRAEAAHLPSCERRRKTGSVEPDRARARNQSALGCAGLGLRCVVGLVS
jgi:hypothetical protein